MTSYLGRLLAQARQHACRCMCAAPPAAAAHCCNTHTRSLRRSALTYHAHTPHLHAVPTHCTHAPHLQVFAGNTRPDFNLGFTLDELIYEGKGPDPPAKDLANLGPLRAFPADAGWGYPRYVKLGQFYLARYITVRPTPASLPRGFGLVEVRLYMCSHGCAVRPWSHAHPW